jgi:hypothetical protein
VLRPLPGSKLCGDDSAADDESADARRPEAAGDGTEGRTAREAMSRHECSSAMYIFSLSSSMVAASR